MIDSPTELPAQLTLGIGLDDEATFDNYLVSEANRELVDALAAPSDASGICYILGTEGAGLTHLLQALCHQENLAQRPSFYLPLADRGQFAPAILEGADAMNLLCLDDLDALAGDPAWERALFTAINELLASRARLVVGARVKPAELGIALADLESRLQLAPLFRLHPLADADKKRLLQLRAETRGIRLDDKVADYILSRTRRGTHALMAVLERLDASSLAHRRPLTVPLVKQTMGW